MRVLAASSLGGAGHLVPVLTVATAAYRQGHEVTVLVPPALARDAERPGLAVVVGDEPPRTFIDDIWDRARSGPPDPGLIDRELFAGAATAAMLGPARSLVDALRPDLVLREPCEYASAIAAYEHATPQAQVGISLARIEWGVLEMVGPPLDHQTKGISGVIATAPYLTQFPAAVDPSPWPDTRRFRPATEAAEPLPESWWEDPAPPLLYVTFGTVLGHLPEWTEVFRTVCEAVSALPVRVLLTTGRDVDVADQGRTPANVHVEQWVDQARVFPHASAVLCHGGSGTTYGALSAGIPVVVCPLFADQTANGRIVADAGAGTVVTPSTTGTGVGTLCPGDVEPLRQAIRDVLRSSDMAMAARRIGHEVLDVPTVDRLIAQELNDLFPRCK